MRWPRRSRAVPSRYVSCFFNLPRADFHVRLHAFSNAEAQPQRDQGLLLRSELGPRLSELVNYISNGFVFVSKSLCVVLKLLLLWSAALPFIYAHAHFQSRVLPRRRATRERRMSGGAAATCPAGTGPIPQIVHQSWRTHERASSLVCRYSTRGSASLPPGASSWPPTTARRTM